MIINANHKDYTQVIFQVTFVYKVGKSSILTNGTKAENTITRRRSWCSRLKKKLTKFGNLGNFPATQILREINFKESGVSKPAFLIVSTLLKFGFYLVNIFFL